MIEAGAALLVTCDGRVRLFEATFVVEVDQGPTAVSSRIGFEDYGSPAVEEPS